MVIRIVMSISEIFLYCYNLLIVSLEVLKLYVRDVYIALCVIYRVKMLFCNFYIFPIVVR